MSLCVWQVRGREEHLRLLNDKLKERVLGACHAPYQPEASDSYSFQQRRINMQLEHLQSEIQVLMKDYVRKNYIDLPQFLTIITKTFKKPIHGWIAAAKQ